MMQQRSKAGRKMVYKYKPRRTIRPLPFDAKLIAIILLLLGASAAAELSGVFSREQFVEANVIDVNGVTIVLGRDCRAIVADTTADQARSIKLGLEKRIDVRPTTHDLYVETLRNFEIEVVEAALVRYEDDIYYGELVLRSGDKVLKLDSRPTDAIAVALRAGAPVLVNKAVLEQQGQNVC